MNGWIVAIVLCAALMHAGWNALVKAGSDKFLTTMLVACGAALIALPFLPFLDVPLRASWPWLIASACCQVIYYTLLAAAYRHGDMSQAYPLMRGVAPLIVAVASVPLLHEHLNGMQMLAVALICGGVLVMRLGAVLGGAGKATRYALLNAAVIASYTMLDGVGVRRSGAPIAYTLWLFVITAIGLLACCSPRWKELPPYARAHSRVIWLGGFGTLASYGLALWAMTQAPVATVAALRETSICFAALIAVVFLREKLSPARLAAMLFIAAGAAAMRLS